MQYLLLAAFDNIIFGVLIMVKAPVLVMVIRQKSAPPSHSSKGYNKPIPIPSKP